MHTLTRSVLLHSGFFVLMLFAVADVVTAQVSAAEREAGRAISTAFLLQITDPARTSGKYTVGVVISAGQGMWVSPRGAPALVEYLHGRDTTDFTAVIGDAQAFEREVLRSRVNRISPLRLAAVEQVAQGVAGFEFLFQMIRKTISHENCPALSTAVEAFYAGLEAALSVPIDLTAPPIVPNAIITDTTDFHVQLRIQDATLSLTRMGTNGHPLQLLLNRLHTVVDRCSIDVPGSEATFWYDYPGAGIRPTPAGESQR